MITEQEKPIWCDYIERDENLNVYLRDDAPEDVIEAYEAHLREIEEMNRTGKFMYKL